MKKYNPKGVLDLYEFLPLDGEDAANLVHYKGDLYLELIYVPEGERNTRKRIIKFEGAFGVLKTSVPGGSPIRLEGELDSSLFHSLVEYERSDWVSQIWDSYIRTRVKHYGLMLDSVEWVLDVICMSWSTYEVDSERTPLWLADIVPP